VTYCRNYLGYEAPASIDHRLLVGTVKVQVLFSKPENAAPNHLHVDRLHSDISLSRCYNLDVKNRFDTLGELDANYVETSWEKLSGAIMDAPNSVVGCKREIRQPWMINDTFEVLQLKAVAHTQGLVHERRRVQGVFNAEGKLDREAYFNCLANEAQLGIVYNNLQPAYRAIGYISGKKRNNGSISVLKSDGSSCSSAEELLSRRREHFDSVLNFPLCSHLKDQATSTPQMEM